MLPRGVDHGVDLALLAERSARVAGGVVKVLILDFNDAFMSVPLHEQERRFNVAVLKEPPSSAHGRVIVWRVLGFGGKSNPLVYCRLASAVARSSQGLVPASCGRLQLYVDDPAFSFARTQTCSSTRTLSLHGGWHWAWAWPGRRAFSRRASTGGLASISR